MIPKRLSFFALVLALLHALLVVSAAPASRATFPGLDGVLVFQSNRDGNYELYTATRTGANARKLLTRPDTNEFNAGWSPSGRRLVYETGPLDRSESDIELVNANGSGRAPLVSGSTFDRAAQFCNESTVVFTRRLSATDSEIYAIQTNGTGLRRLTENPASDSFPTCHPSGDRLAFISNRDGGIPRIWEVGLDGGSPRLVVDTVSLDPDYSPDGSTIAYVAPDADRNLEVFTKNLGTGEVVQRTRTAPPIEYRLPKFAPSHRRVARRALQQGDPRDNLSATQRNTSTGEESFDQIDPQDAGDIPSASGGVFQPLPPCVCRSLTAKIDRDISFADLRNRRRMQLRLFVEWEIACSEGSGRCAGLLELRTHSPNARFGSTDELEADSRETTIACAGPCGGSRRDTRRIVVRGDEDYGFGARGGNFGERLIIRFVRRCGGKSFPGRFVIAFNKATGRVDLEVSDLDGDRKPDFQRKK